MKNYIFYGLMVLLTLMISVILVEVGLRVGGISQERTTWLQYHERGFFMNQKSGYAIDSFNDKRLRYQFTEFRTRGEVPEYSHKRVFVYGDSFTFGLYLNKENTFIHHINTYLNEKQTGIILYNSGVGGSGLSDWVAQLEVDLERGVPIDGIMLVLNYNDFERTLARNQFVLKNGELIASQRWRERGIKRRLDQSRVYFWLQKKSHLVSAIQQGLWKYYYEDLTHGFNLDESDVIIPGLDELDMDSDYILNLADALFSRLRELSDEHEIPVWITTTGFITPERVLFWDERVFANIDSILARNELPYYDITPMLSEAVDGNYTQIELPGDDHPNPEGTLLMARFMKPFIMEQINEHFPK